MKAKLRFFPPTKIGSCFISITVFSSDILGISLSNLILLLSCCGYGNHGVLSDISQVTRLHGFDPVWIVLIVGTVTFILGFAGCVGALRENICLLKFVSQILFLIGLIFFLELTTGVMAFVFQDQLREWVKDFFLTNIKGYREDIDLQNLIDSLQRAVSCCGADGPQNWDLNVYFNCSNNNPSREKCGVPFSCCLYDPAEIVVNTQCGYDVRSKVNLIFLHHIKFNSALIIIFYTLDFAIVMLIFICLI
uniref:Tetraspanin n=1 Tax=Erpetoichthys calabaricus TaxID=27687 RepID=A0A8C4X9I9_ERPCA